ncbi:hypothetical protein [Burkholderia sp. A9]|uniref:hypothetical protein n=1 Tax=Burkholderia sp. A9 TaxID=1365108 RepID=UPI001269918A|nr:hypothetical protein [Burkholderia sp. A9]
MGTARDPAARRPAQAAAHPRHTSEAAVQPRRQHPFGRRDIARPWIKHNSTTEDALEALAASIASLLWGILYSRSVNGRSIFDANPRASY